MLNLQRSAGLKVEAHIGVVELGVGDAVGHGLIVLDANTDLAVLNVNAAETARVTVVVISLLGALKSHDSV
jgi:hypothetical protein